MLVGLHEFALFKLVVMGEKRKGHADGAQGHAKKRRFIAAAHKMQARGGEIRGPGLWITCDRRKEGRAVTEAYDILNEVRRCRAVSICRRWAD